MSALVVRLGAAPLGASAGEESADAARREDGARARVVAARSGGFGARVDDQMVVVRAVEGKGLEGVAVDDVEGDACDEYRVVAVGVGAGEATGRAPRAGV